MAEPNVGKMSTNPTFTQYKEIYIFGPHRNSTGKYRMQRRYQSQLCQNKDHPRPKNPSKPKTSQSAIGTYEILYKIHSSLLRYSVPVRRAIEIRPSIRLDGGMRCFLQHIKKKLS